MAPDFEHSARCCDAPEISRREGLSTSPGWVGRQAGWVWIAHTVCVHGVCSCSPQAPMASLGSSGRVFAPRGRESVLVGAQGSGSGPPQHATFGPIAELPIVKDTWVPAEDRRPSRLRLGYSIMTSSKLHPVWTDQTPPAISTSILPPSQHPANLATYNDCDAPTSPKKHGISCSSSSAAADRCRLTIHGTFDPGWPVDALQNLVEAKHPALVEAQHRPGHSLPCEQPQKSATSWASYVCSRYLRRPISAIPPSCLLILLCRGHPRQRQ